MSIKIGVLCPAEIAFRRFMPALLKSDNFQYMGIAQATEKERYGSTSREKKRNEKEREKKLQQFVECYPGEIYKGYERLITSPEIEAIYIPLPPALHFYWAKRALMEGKHVLIEKPMATSLAESEELINLAKRYNLGLHENYMFQYHNQIKQILSIIDSHILGEIRLYRISFGFPFRGEEDFRYHRTLGGGALFDCGGYTIKLATLLLGESMKIDHVSFINSDKLGVDIHGVATVSNKEGKIAQISFGMDNSYKCQLEIWGSDGYLQADRIFTAPADFAPPILLESNCTRNALQTIPDDQFFNSIQSFAKCIKEAPHRVKTYNEILQQSQYVDEFLKKGNN